MTDGDDVLTTGEIGRSLARIEGRLDRFFDDHETRLRGLEKWKYSIPPTLITSLVTLYVVLTEGGNR